MNTEGAILGMVAKEGLCQRPVTQADIFFHSLGYPEICGNPSDSMSSSKYWF